MTNLKQLKYIEKNIYYLNLQELKKLCTKYNISHNIFYKYDGAIHKSSIMLRKAKILKNIIKYVECKTVSKYIIPELNVCFEPYAKPKLNDICYFGQFKWTDAKKIFPLTFKPVPCHLMLYDLWHKKTTFTYKQFIKFYKDNETKYSNIKHPEWKYIEDNKDAKVENWKILRTKIAKKVIKEINIIHSKS